MVLDVESWWAEPRNLDLDYAFFDATGLLSGGGELRDLAPDMKQVARVRVGWRMAARGEPQVGASFWELDVGAASDTGVHPSMVGALLASPDFAIGRSLVDSARARTRLRATQVDADLRWRFSPGDRSRLDLAAGLRLFRFEQEMTVTYDGRDSLGQPLQEVVNTATDASGLGPRVAVLFGYRLGSRVLFGGEAGFALPVGDLEGSATDTAFRDLDGNGTLDFDRATVVEREGTRRGFTQIDGAITVDVRLGERVDAFALYRYVHWSGVALTQRFVDDVSQNTTLPIDGDALFTGASAGLRFTF